VNFPIAMGDEYGGAYPGDQGNTQGPSGKEKGEFYRLEGGNVKHGICSVFKNRPVIDQGKFIIVNQ